MRWSRVIPLLVIVLGGCRGVEHRRENGPPTISFLVLAGEREVWNEICQEFSSRHPGTRVSIVEGPNSTDLRESIYSASLLANDVSLDLVYMDVTWTSKFAGAGWLLPLDADFPESVQLQLVKAAVDAGRYRGHLFRIPVRTDTGVLYYRKDLLASAGIQPPRTFHDLEDAARTLQRPPELWGFLWQGSQYEGLVCFFLEVLSGFGGFWIDPDTLQVGLDRPEALGALQFLKSCRSGREAISPPGVTAFKEDESRRMFQDGRAVFLRNWPYVWRLAQETGSPVAGRIGVVPMVHAPGKRPAGTLGGWGFGVSRFSRHPEIAKKFIHFAISGDGQRILCGKTGYAPALLSAYKDPELLRANPFLSELERLQELAIARPVVPRYALVSDVLQRALSSALSGLKDPGPALSRAARETRLILRGENP